MMSTRSVMRHLAAAMMAGAALLACLATPSTALADKIHLRDGTVLDGTVVREEGDFYVIEIIKDGKKITEFIAKDDVRKIDKDAPAKPAAEPTKPAEPAKPADPAKPAAEPAKPAEAAKPAEPAKPDAAADAKASPKLTGKVNRVAILNFGPPSSWQGAADDTVGIQINATAWARVIPMLEKDKIDTVVVRINSGGGLLLEVDKFHKVFIEGYKPRFRTVAWVESAISAAAMSPWVLEEFYMMPEGNIGGATAWSGNLKAVQGVGLEQVLHQMEKASIIGKRDPAIARAMQILTPLSAKIDENGEVRWFNDESGIIVNPGDKILTFNAVDAVRFKFARGIAATPDELMKSMGITEYVLAGEEAVKFIDDNIRSTDTTEKRLNEVRTKYEICAQGAAQLDDRTLRLTEVGRARNFLKQMEKMVRENPNFALMNGMGPDWFGEQDRRLKELSR